MSTKQNIPTYTDSVYSYDEQLRRLVLVETTTTARYHVIVGGLGRDAETRDAVNDILEADADWLEGNISATVRDRQTGQEYSA